MTKQEEKDAIKVYMELIGSIADAKNEGCTAWQMINRVSAQIERLREDLHIKELENGSF